LHAEIDHLTSLLYVLLPWNWKTESEDVSIFAASRDQPISSGSNRFAAIAGRTGFAQDSPLEGRDLPPMIKRKKRAITPRDTVVVQCVQAG